MTFASTGFGIQYWLIYLAGLCLSNPLWSSRIRYPVFALVSALGYFTLSVSSDKVAGILPSEFALGRKPRKSRKSVTSV